MRVIDEIGFGTIQIVNIPGSRESRYHSQLYYIEGNAEARIVGLPNRSVKYNNFLKKVAKPNLSQDNFEFIAA